MSLIIALRILFTADLLYLLLLLSSLIVVVQQLASSFYFKMKLCIIWGLHTLSPPMLLLH